VPRYRYFANGKEIFKSMSIGTRRSWELEIPTNILMLLAGQENPSTSTPSGTGSTATSVGKRLGIGWGIKLHDGIYIRNI
jgi:hypothetical protein